MTTILIVDDHPVVRDGLAALIDTVEGMTVVDLVGDGQAAVAAAIIHQPDVVLMDLNMPNSSGVEATSTIVARCPQSRVLVLTMSDDQGTITAAMRAGARGYLLKGASQAEILRAIDTVAAGGASFSSSVADQVLSQIHSGRTAATSTAFPGLTPREREILQLLAGGSRNHSIATALNISAKTVANNVSSIFGKLQVADRGQAIIVARAAGFGIDH